jgi:Ca-activated chloride channel homolog
MGVSLACAAPRKIQLSGKDVAADEGEKAEVRLEIATLDIMISVHGMLASTRMEFSIHNPSDTEAQADFILPLPPNSTVTGYALDIDGEMVDGVYVEKKKARQTYNAIVSRMIDPGLLEAKDDNTFSVNVYPVPEEDSRVFNIEFITDISRQPYELPLNYKGNVKELALSIEVEGFRTLPRIGYPKGLYSPSDRRDNKVHVDNRWKNISLQGNLSIRNEEAEQERLIVERSRKTGEYYFLLEDRINEPAAMPQAVDHITLFWDASISRLRSNTTAEIKLLEKVLRRIGSKTLTVDTIVFRDQPQKDGTYSLESGARPLLERLRGIRYDGASNLEAALKTPIDGKNDYCLLFTDGAINYGSREIGALPCRMYIISSGAKSNHYLEHLAMQSGGAYFSLTAAKPETIVRSVGALLSRLLSVTGPGVEEIYTETISPADGRLRLSGRLVSPEADITLNYGTGDTVTHSRSFELKQSTAVLSENTRLLWARNKIGSLQRTAHPDRETIIGLSRQHGILSPYTSLLVLEDAEQYIEHRIEPPASKKEWVKEYRERTEELEEERAEHFDKVVKQWNKLVKWWKTDFSSQPVKMKKTPASASVEPITGAEDIGAFRDGVIAESLQRLSDTATDEEVVVMGIRASLEDESLDLTPTAPGISIKPWSPDRVYLSELNKIGPEQYFEKYIELRREHGGLPAYYIEVADFLRGKNQHGLALQVLSSLAELETGDYTIRRILGYKLLEYGELDLAIRVLESVLDESTDEPQSFRDLALALIRRADSSLEKSHNEKSVAAAREDYLRALDLLYKVVLDPWDDRFEGIELIALMEINRVIARCKSLGLSDFKVDKRLIRLLDVDMRVVAAWHADRVDIDLWVIEPTGETANYGNRLTAVGGHVSNDMTAGFGPEEYLLRKAPKGKYTVKVHYYGSQGVMPTGAVKLIVDVYSNYARKNEKREVLTIELENKEDEYLVGEIEF